MTVTFKSNKLDKLAYWIEERHAMYLRRTKGGKPPWSKDEVMNTVFFTNPYRENDKVTVWYRQNIREPLEVDPRIIFATIAFRRFNSIQTGEVLLKHGLHLKWNRDKAYREIHEMVAETGLPYTSGAYMIKGEPGREKLDYLCALNEKVYHQRRDILDQITNATTLEEVHRVFHALENVGPFIAYEWVTDIRHTYLLRDATDIDTWCSFGPGAYRGLHRILGEPVSAKVVPYALEKMQFLLKVMRKRLPKMKFEMRDMEHSLCEFDKYMRVSEGGRPKRWYSPYASNHYKK